MASGPVAEQESSQRDGSVKVDGRRHAAPPGGGAAVVVHDLPVRLLTVDDRVAVPALDHLAPLRLREPGGPGTAHAWPTYPLSPGTTYVNVGFWGTVVRPLGHRDGDLNRAIEAKVTELGGHKSLYSDAYYDRETFDSLYGTTNLREVKRDVDPDGRLTDLYDKAVKKK